MAFPRQIPNIPRQSDHHVLETDVVYGEAGGVPLRYDPGYWALVFPLGMYSVATARMLEALEVPFGEWIAVAAFWAAAGAWTITAVGMVRVELVPRRAG